MTKIANVFMGNVQAERLYLGESLVWSKSNESWDIFDLFSTNQGLWFDAADTNSITLAGSKVSIWNDKSGGNQHATQNTASLQPIYDAINKGVKATGSGEKLEGIFGTIDPEKMNEYTMFAIVTPLKTTQSSTVESNSGIAFYSEASLQNIFFAVQEVSNASLISPIFSATTQSFVVTETKDGLAPKNIAKDISMASNGRVLLGVTRASNATIDARIFGQKKPAVSSKQTYLGWGAFFLPSQYTRDSAFNGSIHELLLIHNGALDLETIQKIEGYLAHKWAVNDHLIANHPYKIISP